MKINWGTSIVIAFGLFMAFILFFVFKVQSNPEYDNELVVEEYYKHDARFQEEMQKIQSAEDLTVKPKIEAFEKGIKITFPSEFNPKNIKGKVSLYRPSNKKLDFEIPISLSDSTLLIPENKLVGGRWDITLNWEYDGKEFQFKEVLYLQ
ncbi:nitrogen fixation protein FixH [Flavobacterium arsenatis]|uniref:Nitrogen fixation protein FixH n=1 Tax=Flavobacterium arsenatis TaxID=1484332 RepID=A0ABU1TK95_9FLAO|nr:FixH family protein [Flavobacterium arsenatis]MDR6966266.1 nitrogen fixation protein FixH [Flavobacterium arsenatis]